MGPMSPAACRLPLPSPAPLPFTGLALSLRQRSGLAAFWPHRRAQGGSLWTGSAGSRCLPCSPCPLFTSPGQPSLTASDAQPASSGLTPLFPHLVFFLPSALRPLLSHPKETCLRVTFFDHPVLLRYSSPQCSIVSSVTLIVICSYFIYLLVYFFVCVRRRIVNSLRAPPCLSCPWVLSLEPTRRLAWRST